MAVRMTLGTGAAASLLAVALAGCGGGTPSSGDAPADVRRDITALLTSTDPDDCEGGGYVTRRFSDQQAFKIPEYAKAVAKVCRADTRLFAADAVKVSRVRVDGDRASARVTATGGTLAIGDVTFALVRDRVWKLDRITAVDLDRARFNASQTAFAGAGETGATRAQTACTVRRFARLSDAQLERAVVTADPVLVIDPLLLCFLRPQLREQGLSAAQAGCVVRSLRAQGTGFLRVVLGDDERATRELFKQAGAACANQAIAARPPARRVLPRAA